VQLTPQWHDIVLLTLVDPTLASRPIDPDAPGVEQSEVTIARATG
jgi:hypothetical protein